MQKTNKSKIIIIGVLVFSVCLAGFLSFKYVNRIVEYEIEADSLKNKITVETVYETNPENIPQLASYHLFLKDNNLLVYSDNNELIYLQNLASAYMLSEKDIQELEQSGIHISSRSELLELLNYFNS